MKTSIKIIKQSRRTPPGETQQIPANSAKTENQVRREIAQTVTSWIEERRAVDGITVKERLLSRFMETTCRHRHGAQRGQELDGLQLDVRLLKGEANGKVS